MADPQPSTPEPPPLVPGTDLSQPVSEVTGLPRNVAAGLASIFILVGGIVFLVLERKDRFVRFYAVQSLLLSIVFLMVLISLEVVEFVFTRIPLIAGLLTSFLGLINVVFFLAWFVVYVVMIVKAFSGKEWEIPYLGQIAKKQMAGRTS